MTEQEAEALARRWVRIWMPNGLNAFPTRGENPITEYFHGVFWDFEFADWRSIHLAARVASNALLIVDNSYEGPFYSFCLVGQENAIGKLECEIVARG